LLQKTLQKIDRRVLPATWRNKTGRGRTKLRGQAPPPHLHGRVRLIYAEREASHNHKIATLDVTIPGWLARRLWRLAAVDMGMQSNNESTTRPDFSPPLYPD
jgi:hypothetical protein